MVVQLLHRALRYYMVYSTVQDTLTCSKTLENCNSLVVKDNSLSQYRPRGLACLSHLLLLQALQLELLCQEPLSLTVRVCGVKTYLQSST